MIEHHWLVSWDLPDGQAYGSEVLPHPSVHLVFEPTGAAVYGVNREPVRPATERDRLGARDEVPPGRLSPVRASSRCRR